ncbi:hypothetical protein [Methylobacterium sp. A54F]
MKLAMLACLAGLSALGWAGGHAPAQAAQPTPQAQTQPATQPSAQPAGQPAARPPAQPSARPGAAAAAPGVRGSDRRRRSYAACNRASHTRALRGGARRRFLIRCRLGYERPRTPAPQQAAPQPPAAAPAAPAGRRP